MSGGDGERDCRNCCGSQDHGVYASVGGRNVPLTCFGFAGFAAGFGFGVVFGGVDAFGGGGGVNGPVCVVVVAGGCSRRRGDAGARRRRRRRLRAASTCSASTGSASSPSASSESTSSRSCRWSCRSSSCRSSGRRRAGRRRVGSPGRRRCPVVSCGRRRRLARTERVVLVPSLRRPILVEVTAVAVRVPVHGTRREGQRQVVGGIIRPSSDMANRDLVVIAVVGRRRCHSSGRECSWTQPSRSETCHEQRGERCCRCPSFHVLLQSEGGGFVAGRWFRRADSPRGASPPSPRDRCAAAPLLRPTPDTIESFASPDAKIGTRAARPVVLVTGRRSLLGAPSPASRCSQVAAPRHPSFGLPPPVGG